MDKLCRISQSYHSFVVRRQGSAMPIARPPVDTIDRRKDPSAFSGLFTAKTPPKRPSRKLKKSDLSVPSDCRHLSHVGSDPSSGDLDVSWRNVQIIAIFNSHSPFSFDCKWNLS